MLTILAPVSSPGANAPCGAHRQSLHEISYSAESDRHPALLTLRRRIFLRSRWWHPALVPAPKAVSTRGGDRRMSSGMLNAIGSRRAPTVECYSAPEEQHQRRIT